jgi:threonylcarbamoyladenosine tRNA methylthiotransferase MtaB
MAPSEPRERFDFLLKQINALAPEEAASCVKTDHQINSHSSTPSAVLRSRPFLKIQDGCNAFCTYCIVPYARGRSRSLPVDQVLSKLRELMSEGFFEVVLTGIHLGIYGQDLTPPTDLYALLQLIVKEFRQGRLRLSSIEPNELSEAIIDLVASSERLCKHVHIPLQSGDDPILKRMHRPYTRSHFKELVEKIHAQIPEAAIGADILIGFPGESDASFENTLALVQHLPLSYLHVFPYSSRPGTPAASFPEQTHPQVIKARCARMRALGNQKKEAFLQQAVSRRYLVLVENKRDKATGLLKGLTTNYIPVLLKGPDTFRNHVIEVQIKDINKSFQALGHVCETL